MNDYRYKFVACPDEEEYWRLNHLGKRKGDYLGQVCKQVGIYPPYAMQFADGAVWALDVSQLIELGWAGPIPRMNSYRRNKVIKCVETGMVFTNADQAARWAGTLKKRIASALHNASSAGGYHWEYAQGESE